MSTARVFEVSMVECPICGEETLEECQKCEHYKWMIFNPKRVVCKRLEDK